MHTRFILTALLAPLLLPAEEPPAMPMRARYEDSAAFRWLKKKVLESRTLDDMEDLSTWTFHGQGDMSLTTERVWHGEHALHLRAIPPSEPTVPAGPGGSYGSRPYWSQIEATRRVAGEDWTRFNRISVWIYAEIDGIDAISFFMTLHNEGAEKLPDMSRREGYHFFILQNHAWNHVVWEIGPLSRNKVTAVDFSYWVPKTVAQPDDHVVFDLDQLTLERVDADHYEGWNVAPGRIAFSHSGYPAGATKTAIASDLDSSEFQLIRMDTGTVVLRKTVKRVNTRLGEYQVLDFSEVREPGAYVVEAGNRVTRSFQIGDDSWRDSIWKALNFLYVERCGFEIPGVHGVCHRDALLTHNGKQIVMNGGWHDAGDLSQGPVNTSNAVYGLLALAERMQGRGEDPVLCRRVIEEAKWGLDWVLKTRFGDGYRATFIAIDSYTDNILGDFDDRRVEAQNSPSVNYLSAAVEARACRVLKESDPEMAQRSLRTAQEDWEFAVKGPARRPVAPGADSGPDMELAAIGIIASTDLYQDTGEQRYADKAFELAEVVIGSQQQKMPDWKTPLAGFFYTNPRQEELYHASHVGNEQAPVVAMTRLCELFPNHPDWMRWYAVAALHSEFYLKAAARFTEPYNVLPASIYRESEALHIPEAGNGEMTREIFLDQIRHAVSLGGDYFLRMFPVWTVRRGHFGVLLSQTRALAAAAHLRGDTAAADLAAKQVEWVLGRNPFSESAMYGEGYDFPTQYSERSGDIVGSLPVGIETRANNDEPYWPVQNCFNYKEVWVHPVARWFWLMEDVAGPALVEGIAPAATREPVEFRPESGPDPTVVMPDFATGRFRAHLPPGHYTVLQGSVHLTLALLSGGTYHLDLRPARAIDFHVTSEAGAAGLITVRVTANGAARHTFTLRTFNLDLRDSEKTIALEPGSTATLLWTATLKSRDVPWVVVAFPDGDLDQRQETTGAWPK